MKRSAFPALPMGQRRASSINSHHWGGKGGKSTGEGRKKGGRRWEVNPTCLGIKAEGPGTEPDRQAQPTSKERPGVHGRPDRTCQCAWPSALPISTPPGFG